ncbi:HNH endonuclease [Streptomyces sp. NPDC048419]|uniref:HNH endonuclease n=1 Tax=Streptomyces sp. NPDC048419 TaxID=3365547 RepID=UPI0037152FA3
MEPGAHPTRQSGYPPAHQQSRNAKRSADSVGRPSRKIEAKVYLAARQKGLCPLCRLDLIQGAEYEPDNVRGWVDWFEAKGKTLDVDHRVRRSEGGSDHPSNLRLVHADCHDLRHAGDGRRTDKKPVEVA